MLRYCRVDTLSCDYVATWCLHLKTEGECVVIFRKGHLMELATPLAMELRVFEEHRTEWSHTHPGKYVVIRGETVLEAFFEEYADAFRAGLEKFGVSRSFLVKQIWRDEPVYFIA